MTSLARARRHPVHQGSFSLPGSSNELDSLTLRDVPLLCTLLLIPAGRLEQSPLTLPCLCWDWGGAADQAVLVLLQSKRDSGCCSLVQRTGKGERMSGPEQLELPQRGAEKHADHRHGSITMGQHPVSAQEGEK